MSGLRFILDLLGILIIVATVLPLSRSDRWWVRLCDFPRFQVAVLAIGLLVLMLTRRSFGIVDYILFTGVALSALWQVSWVWRYFPGAPLEVDSSYAAVGSPGRIALMTTNVLQKSRDADALLKIIGEANPDLVLAVETDEWWCTRLSEGLRARYPHSLIYPLSNGYGLAAFSRRTHRSGLVDDAIPSIKTGVRLRSGAVIDLYGLHPQPPAPQQDSTERDVELVMVGKEIKKGNRPAIVLGDLNDVAWSPTTLSFKSAGGLVDPRRGRGFFNTYPAGLPGLRYPLDYIFIRPTSQYATCAFFRVLNRTICRALHRCV